MRASVAEAVEKAFPDRMVEIPDIDESYIWKMRPKLRKELRSLKKTRLLCERTCDGENLEDDLSLFGDDDWYGEDIEEDFDDEPFDGEDYFSSYFLFFLGMVGPQFEREFDVVGPSEDPDGGAMEYTSSGIIGWSVAVSVIVRYAMLVPNDFSQDEYGTSIPDIDHCVFDEDGREVPLEESYREILAWFIFGPFWVTASRAIPLPITG